MELMGTSSDARGMPQSTFEAKTATLFPLLQMGRNTYGVGKET